MDDTMPMTEVTETGRPGRMPDVAQAAAGPLLAGLVLLGGCASPGLSYLARNPAGDPVAASYRTVAVGYFSGPEGGWYTTAFEDMLLGAQFDGGPWFIVHHPGAPEGAYAGHYSGQVDLPDVHVSEHMRTRRKCVEWDGLFDCEHRADVVQACLEVDVAVAVTVRLTDVGSGRVAFGETYHGRADEETCEDVGIVADGDAGRHGHDHDGPGDHGHGRHEVGWRYGRFGAEADALTGSLVREALADTLEAVRHDIAPYHGRARAPLLAEAVDPEVRADPRFAAAVAAAGEGDAGTGCAMFATLAGAYPAAPAVQHNLGACAEAKGDADAAEARYAAALDAMALHPGAGEARETLLRALGRIERLQLDAGALARLPPLAPVPATGPLCPDCITSEPESGLAPGKASKPDDKPL